MPLRRSSVVAFVCIVGLIGLVVLTGDATAQGNPFGAPRQPAAAAAPHGADGVIGWLLARQAEFYRAMSGLVRDAKADGSAVWTLLGVSFLYGVFHAAGPGHGKAVISSYIVANNETWRRGVALSFASALVQAFVAIAVVGVAAAALGLTAKAMGDAVRWIEIASYALIALIGARLFLSKGRLLLAALAERAPAPAFAGHPHAHDHDPDHDHAHGQAHHVHQHHAHHHDAHDHHAHHAHHHHDHACGADCGHAHGPDPALLGGEGGWRRGLAAIFAVGLRPCSGAILVLVFALAQGLFWVGVAATLLMGIGTAITVAAIATLAVSARALAARIAAASDRGGTIAVRLIETAAAGVVLAFGVLLLLGYLASERLMFM